MVGVAGFEPATPSPPNEVRYQTGRLDLHIRSVAIPTDPALNLGDSFGGLPVRVEAQAGQS
jgi:hypothetical protein